MTTVDGKFYIYIYTRTRAFIYIYIISLLNFFTSSGKNRVRKKRRGRRIFNWVTLKSRSNEFFGFLFFFFHLLQRRRENVKNSKYVYLFISTAIGLSMARASKVTQFSLSFYSIFGSQLITGQLQYSAVRDVDRL